MLVSIICPFFNEEKTLKVFFNKLESILIELKDYDFEILFINNASKDKSLEVVKNFEQSSKIKIKYITFTRNFGYQNSILAGYKYSKGDVSIAIDTDLEDPPEMIKDFLEKHKEGYEIVYGKRVDRVENWFLKKGRNIFYKLLNLSADYRIFEQMAEFCLISKKVRKIIISNNNTFNFFRSEIAYTGYEGYPIAYKRSRRIGGKSSYNIFFSPIKFAISGFLTTSTFFLRFSTYIFPLLLIINFILFFFYKDINTIIFFNLIFLGALLSIIALYIARIYQILVDRPPYVIDDKLSKL